LAAVYSLSSRTGYAQFTFLGPAPYRSAADSPFNLSGLGTTFFLEDFEDTAPQLGIANDPSFPDEPAVEFLRRERNSVDADDGLIDNSGAEGYSAAWIESVDVGSAQSYVVRFYFDATELGFLPTAVGLVITDGAGPRSQFTAYGSDGTSAFINTDDLMLSSLTSSDDRFIGVRNPIGISRITFTKTIVAFDPSTHGPDPRVDHLQYGLFVPEPGTVVFAACAMIWLLATRTNRPQHIDKNY
jgi:hypothetical protein